MGRPLWQQTRVSGSKLPLGGTTKESHEGRVESTRPFCSNEWESITTRMELTIAEISSELRGAITSKTIAASLKEGAIDDEHDCAQAALSISFIRGAICATRRAVLGRCGRPHVADDDRGLLGLPLLVALDGPVEARLRRRFLSRAEVKLQRIGAGRI